MSAISPISLQRYPEAENLLAAPLFLGELTWNLVKPEFFSGALPDAFVSHEGWIAPGPPSHDI
jgi:hypothetical protein